MELTFQAELPPEDEEEGQDLLTALRAAMTKSQQQNRGRGSLKKKWPRTQLMVCTRAWADNRYDLIGSDGVERLSRVWCAITSKTLGPVVPVGATVNVWYTENGTPYIKAFAPSTVTVPRPAEDPNVPLIPRLWLQHEAFWWLPGEQRNPQDSMSIVPGSTLFLDTLTNEDALENALNFRGLVAFPQGDDQIIATLTAVYEPAGELEHSETQHEDIDFVIEEEASPPEFQVEGRSFVLSQIPDPPIPDDLDPSYEHTPPEGFSPTVLYPISSPQTFGLAMRPSVFAVVDYLYSFVDLEDHTDNFAGDGVQTDFNPGGDPQTYTLSTGGTIVGPAAWIDHLWAPPEVDGIPDLLATFFEGTVRFSFAPDPGAYIEIFATYAYLTNYSETLFGDGPVFSLSLTGVEKAYLILRAGAADGTDTTPNALLTATGVVFLAIFVPGDSIAFTYQYSVTSGETWNIAALRIIEKNVNTSIQVILDTPLPEPFLAHFKSFSDGSTVLGNDLAKLGQLFYDPLSGSYTIAGPTGLIWRDRVVDLESAGGPHFTLMPWPDSGFSQDGNLLYSDLTTVPRLPQPWYGLSAASKFAITGAWNRVGGAETYPGAGDQSDTEAFLPMYRRNVSNVWENHHTLDVKTLAQSPTSGRLNVLGSCYTGINLYATYPYTEGNDTSHPMTRNLVAWIVACGWNVTGYNGETGTSNGGAGGQSPVGWLDAGLTLNAIDPNTGAILSQHTLKCDSDEIFYIYEDPMAAINQQIEDGPAFIASVIDKYVNNNPIYWPPTSGSVPAQPIIGFETYGATPGFFEYPPGSGDAFFMVGRLTGLEEQGAQIRQFPGLPGFDPQGYELLTYSSENPSRQMNPKLLLDELNNLYLYLYMRIWETFGPELSDANGGVVKYVTGSVTHPHASNGTPQPQPLYEIVSTENLLIATGGDPPDGITSSNFGLVIAPSFPLQFSNEFRSVAWFYPVTAAGFDPMGTPLFTSPANTLIFTWKSYTFNPTFAGITGTYTGLPRPIETLTFSGWIEVPQNYAGFITYDYVSDWTAQYFTLPRLILYKIHFDEAAKTFTEIWRKDTTELLPALGYDPPRAPIPEAFWAVSRAVAGRYIFDLRPAPQDYLTSNTLYLLHLNVLENGSTAPGDPARVEIPNSLRDNLGLVEFYDMIADVDNLGREIVTVWHVPAESPTLYLTIITFPETGPPGIEQIEIELSSPPNFPNPTTSPILKRLIRVNNSYYWDDRNGKIYRKEAPT